MEQFYFQKIDGQWTLSIDDLLRFKSLGGGTMDIIVKMLKSRDILSRDNNFLITIRYVDDEARVDVRL